MLKIKESFILPVAGGTITGCTLGAIANFSKTASLVGKSVGDCSHFDNLPVVGALNSWRNGHCNKLLLPLLPAMQIIPSSILAVKNALRKGDNGPKTDSNTLRKIGSNLFSTTLSPLLRSLSVSTITSWLREHTKRPMIDKLKIDVSGHTVRQVIYLYSVLRMTQALSKIGTPNQVKMISAALAGLSLVEIPWMYNTTANCHSIADVVFGAAFSIFGSLVTEKYAVPLFKYGYEKIKACGAAAARFLSQINLPVLFRQSGRQRHLKISSKRDLQISERLNRALAHKGPKIDKSRIVKRFHSPKVLGYR